MKHFTLDEPIPKHLYRAYEDVWFIQQFPQYKLSNLDELSYADKQRMIAVVSAQTQYRQYLRNQNKK